MPITLLNSCTWEGVEMQGAGCSWLREVRITEDYFLLIHSQQRQDSSLQDHSPLCTKCPSDRIAFPLNTPGGQAPILRTEFQKDKKDFSKSQMNKHIYL